DPTHGATVFSSAQTWAGIVMAVLAPALGSWGDRVRSSKLMLTITTLGAIICTALLWFTKPEDSYLLYGAVVIAVGGLFVELAGVFYNAILLKISTPETYGRISGFDLGILYIGDVIDLILIMLGVCLGDCMI